MKRLALVGLGFIAAFAVTGASLTSVNLRTAEDLYKRTQFEGSIALLDKHSDDAATNFLLGRDYLMTGSFKNATEYIEKAAAADPKNAEYLDWLGRAYGRRAETSSPFLAPGYASKARQAFEVSVQLNPSNPDALSDLFDFYLEAPGFLGGGYDKAAVIAAKIAAVDPSEGYFEQAKLAQKRKEFGPAEQHLRQAIAATPGKVSGLLELAKFLANQGRTRESDAALAQAEQIQPNAPRVWYTRANIFIRQRRNLDEARLLLERYMRTSLTVDDPPKEQAAKLLKEVAGA